MLHIDNVTGPTCDKSVELSQVSFEAREFAQQQLVLNALLKISRHTNDSALLDAVRKKNYSLNKLKLICFFKKLFCLSYSVVCWLQDGFD